MMAGTSSGRVGVGVAGGSLSALERSGDADEEEEVVILLVREIEKAKVPLLKDASNRYTLNSRTVEDLRLVRTSPCRRQGILLPESGLAFVQLALAP